MVIELLTGDDGHVLGVGAAVEVEAEAVNGAEEVVWMGVPSAGGYIHHGVVAAVEVAVVVIVHLKV